MFPICSVADTHKLHVKIFIVQNITKVTFFMCRAFLHQAQAETKQNFLYKHGKLINNFSNHCIRKSILNSSRQKGKRKAINHCDIAPIE